ncbi:SPOR domain-containing protein [Prodigiosinella aquatilis]|nr:SPOR domain-containing protein [Prodigiosinella sp. LS101]WJV54253.1 SPOR domain-containing protein [Prodigiosinella sp. LS101]WJV58615.1 SPOR domain-containing protein [Pectobacteriaceae bacterium C111]
MGEFNPEDDLKPDASDHRPPRQQKKRNGFAISSVALSRQYVMIGIGILVLLLLIIGIGSALQAPPPQQASQQPATIAKNIDLSSSSSTAQGTPAPVVGNNVNAITPQTLSAPPISDTPTQAPLQPQNANQQRIELPGNIADTLSQPQKQDRINAFTQEDMGNHAGLSTLPTTPATVTPPPGTRSPSEKMSNSSSKRVSPEHQVPVKSTYSRPKTPTTAVAPAPSSKVATSSRGSASTVGSLGVAIKNAPASYFTLQLSGASHENSLKAYARAQKLTNYWVYKTKRDGQPWYVLVNGVYASSGDARRAVVSLPADVQAKKPWVKPIRQVKQDLSK